MFLILDEWLIHDLENESDTIRQNESFQFLMKIKEKCDKIILVEDSKFMNKLWDFSKKASTVILKRKFKFLKDIFLYNSQKTKSINLHSIDIQNCSNFLEGVNTDDHYLVLSYIYFKNLKQKDEEVIIITTDKKLKETIEKKGISIEFRDDFIRKYKNN
jgi:hypothetical protein